jgi:signal transduction histidine kinase
MALSLLIQNTVCGCMGSLSDRFLNRSRNTDRRAGLNGSYLVKTRSSSRLQLIRRSRSRHWFSAFICVAGSAALVAVAYLFFLLQADFATAAFSLLVVVVLLATLGTYASSVVLSLTSVACLSYFFSPPIFSFRMERQEDIVALLAYLTTSIVITGLAAKVRGRSEEELLHTRAELARFARMATLGELTASIAHEINQPLAGVISSADACRRWLANQPPNIERANQSLERIIRDSDRASKVVERVRGLAKNAPPQKAAASVVEALREVIVLTRREVEQNNVRLETELEDDLPFVWADRIQLQQVLLNLVVNAIESIKDLRNGPRNVLVRAEKNRSTDVLLSVSDTGTGFDPGNTEDIFNAFYTTKPEGMGMGLAISRSIIEAHGGRLWVSDNFPRGAKFQFTLPSHR